MCSCKQLNLMLLISKRKLYLMLVVMEQCQCMNPDESVRRRTEVLSCDWVHKFTLESVLRRTEVLFCDWVHKFTLESVRRRTEVLSCGWVHKFTLESGGRSEDSINLLTLGWTIRWGRECIVQIFVLLQVMSIRLIRMLLLMNLLPSLRMMR